MLSGGPSGYIPQSVTYNQISPVQIICFGMNLILGLCAQLNFLFGFNVIYVALITYRGGCWPRTTNFMNVSLVHFNKVNTGHKRRQSDTWHFAENCTDCSESLSKEFSGTKFSREIPVSAVQHTSLVTMIVSLGFMNDYSPGRIKGNHLSSFVVPILGGGRRGQSRVCRQQTSVFYTLA